MTVLSSLPMTASSPPSLSGRYLSLRCHRRRLHLPRRWLRLRWGAPWLPPCCHCHHPSPLVFVFLSGSAFRSPASFHTATEWVDPQDDPVAITLDASEKMTPVAITPHEPLTGLRSCMTTCSRPRCSGFKCSLRSLLSAAAALVDLAISEPVSVPGFHLFAFLAAIFFFFFFFGPASHIVLLAPSFRQEKPCQLPPAGPVDG
uniref:Uncharacterized protein n=1 Tax=Oryza punctata TaxID=4537 RepID=A0A0E0KGY2_ORYPU